MSKLRVFAKYWLPVIAWMLLIFSASGDTKSAQRSSRIIEPLLRWLFPDLDSESVWAVVLVARKCAHLTVFGVLALLLWRAFRRSGNRAEPGWSRGVAVKAWLCVVAYAVTDELHQSFVPSRQGTVGDVVIDSTGGAAALAALWAFGRWRKWW